METLYVYCVFLSIVLNHIRIIWCGGDFPTRLIERSISRHGELGLSRLSGDNRDFNTANEEKREILRENLNWKKLRGGREIH